MFMCERNQCETTSHFVLTFSVTAEGHALVTADRQFTMGRRHSAATRISASRSARGYCHHSMLESVPRRVHANDPGS